jgi:hypothetical protein
VKLQFHLIVQDSTNLDDVLVADAVEEEVTTAPTAPGDVQCPEARHDIVAGLRPCYARVIRKLAHRLKQRIPIGPGLPRAKILGRPLDYVCEFEFSDGAETNMPLFLGHQPSFAGARNDHF